jgi:predicted dehydrogenase
VSSGAKPQYDHRVTLQDYTRYTRMVADAVADLVAIFVAHPLHGDAVRRATAQW